MIISKISVKNFRLLKNFSIDLEKDLSLILGKNNCGKTSLLLVLDKFLNGKSFSWDDFSIGFKDELKKFLESYSLKDGSDFPFIGISLKIFIEYDDLDDLSNIGDKIIMDLDPNNRVVVLGFEYYISESNLIQLRKDYNLAMSERNEGNSEMQYDILSYVKKNISKYFKIAKKSIFFDVEQKREIDDFYTDLIKEKIQIERIINFKWINAKRNVSNKDKERSLSTQSAVIYNKMENENLNKEVIDKFKDELTVTDKKLEDIYQEMFKEIIDDVKKFGGTKQDESLIRITSTLQHKELLENNTTVVYGDESEGIQLPENYNGLGYMNLISMIFEIKIILHEFQKLKSTNPADVNLLFIEEPEVHTHPQMQRVFIKNIKSLLANGIPVKMGGNRTLQTIISTHSSNIVSESDFEDIKYLKKINGSVIANNLKDLKGEYEEQESYYKFLKQYLTLHRADLFFADKAIFIEGDTERILLPAMMKKIDNYDDLLGLNNDKNKLIPLLSQNISIVEVGAYSQVFEKFIDFIGIKSLVITDIDSVKNIPEVDANGKIKLKKDGTQKMKKEACRVIDGEKTSNESLKFFYGGNLKIDDLVNLKLSERVLKKDHQTKKWVSNFEGHVLFVYQSKEVNSDGEEYHARSFEDSFFHINKSFIIENTCNEEKEFVNNIKFPNLKASKIIDFIKGEVDSYEMAGGVIKKPSFAMEILMNSKTKRINICDISIRKERIFEKEFYNWSIPKYIEEGLQWLKAD